MTPPAQMTELTEPHLWMCLPFVALLLAMATLPLAVPHWWERHYPKVALGLAVLPGLFYPAGRLLEVGWEYFGFVAYIGSLFVVAGGVHIRTRGEATPFHNLLFLLGGAVLANAIGTTGASMLLIRPWIRRNQYRITAYHIAFFILIISNVGGCLTPIGDPPLFLGYLKGVPFWWVARHCVAAWAVAIGMLLAMFYVVDRRNFLRAPRDVRESQTAEERLKVDGLRNAGWLALILAAVFVKEPHGLREGLMVVAALGSWWTTPKAVHEANDFTLQPIREVAWLFAGIFATMVPALDYLERHAGALGIREPMQFYWLSGLLSGVLDNAPTYLTFLASAFGLKALSIDDPTHVARFLEQHAPYAVAISLGSVFCGALTYIGNGPNLMVKAIAEQAKVRTPHFFEYLFRYSLPAFLPVLGVVGWLYFGR
jgi:Na+/H+ antiporter NhaD/arsenite permease-like protein